MGEGKTSSLRRLHLFLLIVEGGPSELEKALNVGPREQNQELGITGKQIKACDQERLLSSDTWPKGEGAAVAPERC